MGDTRDSEEAFESAFASGMALAFHAAARPDAMALWTEFGQLSFSQLNARVNQLSRLFRNAGLGAGDAIAVVLKNRCEFVEAYYATQRTGIRFTPINWHLSADEVGYVLDNCEAQAVLFDASLDSALSAVAQADSCVLRLSVGGDIDGFQDLEETLEGLSGDDIDAPLRGSFMLYTSGTTGRPKGVYRKENPVTRTAAQNSADWDPAGHLTLCTGPAYHAAPMMFNVVSPLNSGVGVVLMNKWDAELTLQLVQRFKITHSHMVATMFNRLLQLPESVRSKYDLSSLVYVIHGAAPCPIHIKRKIIEWFGPIVFEYYAATEGGANFFVDSTTWLSKPGTVGRPEPVDAAKVMNEEGLELAQGETGLIYFKAPKIGRFEYFKAEEKTSSSYIGDWFTLGDMGYFDADGYLFLNGRSAETIISGGVNIYPQEIDTELMQHPAVFDVCTVGVPSAEWGESVRAVVQLCEGFTESEALISDILEFVKPRLAGFKIPRGIDFANELPRLPSGKIQRGLVRKKYWLGRDSQI